MTNGYTYGSIIETQYKWIFGREVAEHQNYNIR